MTDSNDLNFSLNINENKEKTTKQVVSEETKSTTADEKTKEKIDFTNFLQHAHHPFIVFFTLLFKVSGAIIFLLLAGILGDSLSFVLIVILAAFDFWYVKNISGRFLVGLRWWNEVNEDGTEEWIYESEHEVRTPNIDSRIFWGSLYITPIFWGVFLLFNLISLSLLWSMICLICMVLAGSNMTGYLKCSGEQRKKIGDFITEKASAGITNLFMGNSEEENKQQKI